MTKKIMALALATMMILSLAVVGNFSATPVYAADAVTSATTWNPTPEPTPAPAPAPAPKPAPAPAPAPTAPATSTTPAPTAQAPNILRVLLFGMTGDDVALMQTYLIKVGHEIEADGSFGPMTLGAVKAFQANEGLTVDGFFGPKTNAALFAKVEVAVPVVDVVTTASLVNNIEDFKAGISTEGTWIISILNDMTSEEALVLDGVLLNGKKDKVTGEDVVQRKIALYTQDEDRNVTARFTLTAPKLTINSPNARIQSGTFVGDVFVNEEMFQLVDAVVEGNLYFTNQAAKDSFKMDDKSSVTGEIALIQTDVTTTASLVATHDDFKAGISEDGTWIVSVVKDLVFWEPLTVTGEFMHRDALSRKIALYSQDEDRNVTRRFTLTAPSITFDSPSARIQGGIFVGDVYVNADNFKLVDATVEGNVYLTTESAKATFDMDDKSSVTGVVALYEPDAITTASLVRTPEALTAAMMNDGTWIAAILNDIEVDHALFLMGEFSYKETIQRKIALYSQDTERNVTRRFTLTAPELYILSPITRMEKGDFVGDLYVSAPDFKLNVANVTGDVYVSELGTGFTMAKSTVSGNVYFASQEVMDTFVTDEASVVEGTMEVK